MTIRDEEQTTPPEPERDGPPDREQEPATAPGPPGNPDADQADVEKGQEQISKVVGR